MNGFRAQLIDKIVGINGHIVLYFNNENYKNYNFIEKIDAIQNVKSVAKEVEMHAMISSEYNSSGILVKGINKADLFERRSIEENITEGTIENFQNNNFSSSTGEL